MESMVPEFDRYQFVRERTGAALPGIVPSNTYVTRDGRFVVIGANGDSIFKRLMSTIGRPDLAADPTLERNDGRVKRTEELDQVIGEWCARHDLDTVLSALEQAEVPSGKIYNVADIVADPHFNARGMIEQSTLEDGTPLKLPGIVPKLSRTPGETRWLGPALGVHTAEVLGELGYTSTEIEQLRSVGAI